MSGCTAETRMDDSNNCNRNGQHKGIRKIKGHEKKKFIRDHTT
jgi:hypothetical protein